MELGRSAPMLMSASPGRGGGDGAGAGPSAASYRVIDNDRQIPQHRQWSVEFVAELRPGELDQVIKIVSRRPSCYPPRTFAALKDQGRHLRALTQALRVRRRTTPARAGLRGRCRRLPPNRAAPPLGPFGALLMAAAHASIFLDEAITARSF